MDLETDRVEARGDRGLIAFVGPVLTALWLGGAVGFLFLGPTRLADMKPNEFGDFFAGIFAPVAFLWLVLGYRQQGVELRQNTKALQLQVEQNKKSVEHQDEIAKANLRKVQMAEEARYAELVSMQPVFSNKFAMIMPSSDSKYDASVYLEFENEGAACSSLSVYFDGVLVDLIMTSQLDRGTMSI